MSRYIDADLLKYVLVMSEKTGKMKCGDMRKVIEAVDEMPTADVRENIQAQKIIGGGEHDGSTCWFECSHCHGTVDIQDMFCKHCGAVFEYEKRGTT